MPYRYERGEHRRRHRWKHSYAGFLDQHGHLVGKCPNTLTDALAETLLNQAIAEPDPFAIPGKAPDASPKRFYAVYKGVIYEASPTQPGKSYHGYPWRGREGRGPLAAELVQQLRARARAEGYLDEFENWLGEHS